MPLGELIEVIEKIRGRIQHHERLFGQSEALTRYGLIDPLLRELGWDTEDPTKVRPEYPDPSGRPDYALFQDEKPVAMLEAKSLGTPLDVTVVHRAMEYCTANGVRHAVVTNGDKWEAYDLSVFSPNTVERRKCAFSIRGDAAYRCALQALYLWRPNLASGQPASANEPILVNNTAFTKPQETAAPSPAPLPPAAPPTSGDGWVPFPEFNPPSRSEPPPAMRFPDGSVQKIQRWNDLLVVVSTWLYAAGRLAVGNMPVRSSSKIYIVHNQPIHPTGNQFFQYRSIADTPLVVNTHGSAVQIRKNAQTLLEHCGVSPDTVQLQVRE